VKNARIYIALGSNIEPRSESLAHAREILQRISEGQWAQSPIIETEPVGPQNQAKYLNQVVSFDSSRSASSLLHYCKGAEIILGRKERGRWDAREIDLDLLYCGQEICKPNAQNALELPHPRIAERLFVLEPLCALHPDWCDPVTGLSMQEMRDHLLYLEAP
jgi:2-amino-4-hydroxy-6-hydroxymethyldihydropteridine diphosphokinase